MTKPSYSSRNGPMEYRIGLAAGLFMAVTVHLIFGDLFHMQELCMP